LLKFLIFVVYWIQLVNLGLQIKLFLTMH
jgi:hypothetical protein